MYRFALIGAAGYVAPRHMKAIRETGNQLVATLDPYDGIGVLDEYFPAADFFTEPERFDRHLDKLRRQEDSKIDYVSICSPNYLHDAHIRMALRNEANAICEKPVVLNPWNLDALELIEAESGKNLNVILQLRLHPSIRALRNEIGMAKSDRVHELDLTYIASRGRWYDWSWKGNEQKSGGVATNIGIHFFDMISHIFGDYERTVLHYRDKHTLSGISYMKNARVRWFLSVSPDFLPAEARENGQRTFRQIVLDGRRFEFSDGFTGLHTESYKAILKGEGYRLNDARTSVQMVYEMRHIPVEPSKGEQHPLTQKVLGHD